MQFNTYLNEQNITYEQYCIAVDYAFGVNEGLWGDIKDKTIGVLTKVLDRVKTDLLKIGADFQIGMGDILDAFKSKSMFNLFKSLGWSIGKLIKAVDALSALIRDGLLNTFKQLHKTQAIQKIRSGAMKVDELFESHPILAKLAGPAVAGLLFWIWLNMTFIGNLDYDMDFSNMAKALAGHFSLADLFASPEGLMLTTLLATGTLISAPWLGLKIYNLVLALVYTGLKNAKGKDIQHKVLNSMHSKIKWT
jgi:hypothetical protein